MAEALHTWLGERREELERELFGVVLPFWTEYSIDSEQGGFFTCLDATGQVYDEKKYVWLQGRQCWMFARIANSYTEEEITALSAKHRPSFRNSLQKGDSLATRIDITRPSLINAAKRGVDFLFEHAIREEDGHVYFCLSRDGKPVLHQRKPFSALFLVMALKEVGVAISDSSYVQKAMQLFLRAKGWIDTPGSLGKPALEGAPPLEALAEPMILLNVAEELLSESASLELSAEHNEMLREIQRQSVRAILKHVIRDPISKRVVHVPELVKEDGTPYYEGTEGRVLNYGHVIEAGWFLLSYCRSEQTRQSGSANDGDHGQTPLPPIPEIEATALEVLDWAFEEGWDEENGGGILYFGDAKSMPVTSLEWSLKLFWPINEAMVASMHALLTVLHKGRGSIADSETEMEAEKQKERFSKTFNFALQHMSDEKHGEWYGYLNRECKVHLNFKGAAYKGCFHVPRSLLFCRELVDRALSVLEEGRKNSGGKEVKE
uniref:N-acylglucosamine 2-epimerase n=1 Tax=Palpitomonas bilix TaxID=652834 RepID=A0A7S3CY66_9EUKA